MSNLEHSAESDRAPVHLLIVNEGESLRDHKTACGLMAMGVPARDGLTQSWDLFTCRACADWFTGSVTAPGGSGA